ncbi:hypothetical protein [Ancylobacter polymorphus]|uniref:Uncharacterized protein n=1 Tax=Ancylobacter polymorphus TaxID=223390 RepID=A0A9E7A9J3_9HYPH|nr:hypothetical protein [Ancylobacter polymorphus]UOK73294.1 hypothetical protein K9D25_21850 [Ancylobacter polymorphus]
MSATAARHALSRRALSRVADSRCRRLGLSSDGDLVIGANRLLRDLSAHDRQAGRLSRQRRRSAAKREKTEKGNNRQRASGADVAPFNDVVLWIVRH